MPAPVKTTKCFDFNIKSAKTEAFSSNINSGSKNSYFSLSDLWAVCAIKYDKNL